MAEGAYRPTWWHTWCLPCEANQHDACASTDPTYTCDCATEGHPTLAQKADPSVCRCSHGSSCHVCEGCEDHHEPACPRSAPVEQEQDRPVTGHADASEARLAAAEAEVDVALSELDAATDRYRDALDALAAAETAAKPEQEDGR